jgi:hypothetical protein
MSIDVLCLFTITTKYFILDPCKQFLPIIFQSQSVENLSKLNLVQEHIIFQENNVFLGKLLFGGLLFSKFITFNTDDAEF